MQWPSIEELTARAPLPDGYHYAYPTKEDVPAIIEALKVWYPGIAVGNASCHMRRSFYLERVYFGSGSDRDFLVTLIKHQNELVAVFSVERDVDSQVIYGRIGAISRSIAGRTSADCFFLGGGDRSLDADGHGLRLAAALKYPHFQRTFERMGWQLIGIMPGFDRELIETGEIRRVYEAAYVKVLQPEQLLAPSLENLTPAVRRLYEMLFQRSPDGTDA